MNDITSEQKKEFIIEALTLSGFQENDAYPGIYSKTDGNIKSVVDLTAGVSAYLYDHAKRQKIAGDDDNGTLRKLDQLILDAEDGKMPSKTKPDIVYGRQDEPIEPQTHECACSIPAQEPTANLPTAKPSFVPQGRMIKDITPGLKEIGKIKIGRKGSKTTGSGYRLPEKFDHFEVVSTHKDEHGDFRPDKAVMGLIGDNAKELDVTLLYNDPTLNFLTRYNQYQGGKCMCSGDGVEATEEDGTVKQCDPAACSMFKSKKCKPNGILSVILRDAPRLGGVYKFRTTSYNSIRSIMSSMFFIQSLTGGVLAGIPLKMTVSPQSVNPVGSPAAQTIYVVNLEYSGNVDDLQKTVVGLLEQRKIMHSQITALEQQARLALDMPETVEDIQDAVAEFYPDTDREEAGT